jgi:hypothetical protein
VIVGVISSICSMTLRAIQCRNTGDANEAVQSDGRVVSFVKLIRWFDSFLRAGDLDLLGLT